MPLPPPAQRAHCHEPDKRRGQGTASGGRGVLSTGGPGYRRGRRLDAAPGGLVCLTVTELPIPGGFPLV